MTLYTVGFKKKTFQMNFKNVKHAQSEKMLEILFVNDQYDMSNCISKQT